MKRILEICIYIYKIKILKKKTERYIARRWLCSWLLFAADAGGLFLFFGFFWALLTRQKIKKLYLPPYSSSASRLAISPNSPAAPIVALRWPIRCLSQNVHLPPRHTLGSQHNSDWKKNDNNNEEGHSNHHCIAATLYTNSIWCPDVNCGRSVDRSVSRLFGRRHRLSVGCIGGVVS